MRVIAPLSIGCLVALLTSGWLFVRASAQRPPSIPPGLAIQQRVREFLRLRPPEARVDVEATFGPSGRRDLMDPSTALPFMDRFPAPQARSLYALATTCRTPAGDLPLAAASAGGLGKATRWARFICGLEPAPEDGFFRNGPFMHPAGASYVRLAAATGRQPFKGPVWLAAHADLLHVTELPQFPAALAAVPDSVRLLAQLDRTALGAILRAQAVVSAADKVWMLERRQGGEAAVGTYSVFPLAAWRGFSADLPYELVVRSDRTACVLPEGSSCWVNAPSRRGADLVIYEALAAVSALGLALSLATLLGDRVRQARRQRADQLFVLQTLTHELRTPATGMALEIDVLRCDFDRLTADGQRAFLSVCDQVSRLGRVIAGSARYLNAQAHQTLGTSQRLEPLPIESMNAFLLSVLETYAEGGQVSAQLLPVDCGWQTDPYWLRMCINNLVENALQHGSPAVEVRLRRLPAALEIAVKDGGSLSGTDLKDLTRAFARRRPAERGRGHGEPTGLGLGLSIVSQVAVSLNGSLTLLPEPTTFVLRIRELKT